MDNYDFFVKNKKLNYCYEIEDILSVILTV